MVRYLIVFLQARYPPNEAFSLWRKEILSEWAEFSPCLYLDADNSATETNKYRNANLYRVNDGSFSEFSRLDQHLRLQTHSANGHLVTYHWQLHDGICEIRQSPLPTSTVITAGITIPDDKSIDRELNRWYSEEHMPGLATVPGWLAGTRMKLVHTSDPDEACAAIYLAIHEWAEPNGLYGELWKKVVFTPWTERISALQSAPMYRRNWKLST